MSMSEVTYADLAQRLAEAADAAPFVLDVREPDEWNEEHLACATLIPMGDIPAKVDQIPAGELWIHCRSGGRAQRIAEYLNKCRNDLNIHVVKQTMNDARATDLEVIDGA